MTDQEASIDLVFIDTETTGLDPSQHEMVEFFGLQAKWTPRRNALEKKSVLSARIWTGASLFDPAAAAVNRFYKRDFRREVKYKRAIDLDSFTRTAVWQSEDMHRTMQEIGAFLDGRVLVGSNPAFDAEFIRSALDREHLPATWEHRKLDIVQLASMVLFTETGEWEASSRGIREAFLVDVDPAELHTAQTDTLWVIDLFEKVFGVEVVK